MGLRVSIRPARHQGTVSRGDVVVIVEDGQAGIGPASTARCDAAIYDHGDTCWPWRHWTWSPRRPSGGTAGWPAGHPSWAKIDLSEKLVHLKLRRDKPSNL